MAAEHPPRIDASVHSTQDKLVLERVPGAASPLFGACLEILTDSIPASERLSEARLKALLASGRYRLYAFHDSSSKVAGSAVLYFSQARPVALLDYMAVRPELRGQGIGSALFREVSKVATHDASAPNWLVLEVDDDREGTQEERRLNHRRIEFYRRLGARLLTNVPYLFPSDSAEPVPMRLMVLPLRSDSSLSPADLRLAIQDIFRGVHGRSGNDPVLRWFVEHEPSRLILE